ncbi:calcium activated cation channel [Macrolepiota fuliginosa MF-IS2]|uniref:Calcium activated cation channel n=1 Tax=Macrolepiota fuliginosa MF-IS2 TaxID=1400762 RepID=A0A9P6BWV2_9AGAR|nr:calcium activated cation channel [Macrolepiota fuliginosa MF-IS2]
MSGLCGLTNGNDEESNDLLQRTGCPSPDTITKLVRRLRALTLTLLPVEVDPDSINDPTSRIITPQVINAYQRAAGDFGDALPYCLLRACAEFMWDANHNPADYGENYGRAIACEVLARRIAHLFPRDKLTEVMATRYQHLQVDGDVSETSSALEMAIDQHCTIFLSSTEAQEVVDALWSGQLIQVNNKHHDIDYVPYSQTREHTFLSRIDASRLSVPRYQNIFRIIIWLFFLVVYSQAVREPLDKINLTHRSFDAWEIVLYLMALSFTLEDLLKLFKLLRLVTWWRAFSFWNSIALITDSLLIVAFTFRVLGMQTTDEDAGAYWRLYSFQILSCVAPFIWMKLLTVFDGYKYIGTMQICVARMLKESGIFFALLSVLAIGFAQGLFALDAADGTIESPLTVVNVLVQALLQSPNYEKFSTSPIGLLLYYFWNTVTAIVLLNVLISLFSSAYSDVVDNAEAQYLAFFAGKTVGMIRAPDSYVYIAPFNVIEAVFVVPFELFPYFHLSEKNYAKLNRYVMSFIFFIPLTLIALYESTFDPAKHTWVDNWWRGDDEGEEDSPQNRDPAVDDAGCRGMEICKVQFEELIKEFPNTTQSSEATILKEINELKTKLDLILQKLGD